MKNELIRGYKVFRPDWSCRPDGGFKQYSCPGRFQQDGVLDVCGNGMHFCLKLSDCFSYYQFNSENKVAEVIAHGEVLRDGDKCCTNDLEIVRELTWQEVLTFVNTGKDCTGYCNTGDRNTGDRNTGSWNTGSWNTGYCNTGDRNTGDRNTGDRNTGDRNTGSWNTGSWNTGYCNTGDRNTGDRNTGDRNTGDRNTGSWNTGDWNLSSFNTGCFMTEEQPIMMFNKPTTMTYRDWMNSNARYLLNRIPKNAAAWICASDMTDQEKTDHPEYQTTGGYLKTLDESDVAQTWWDDLRQDQRDIVLALPNFDAEIFFQCTGIKVDAENA